MSYIIMAQRRDGTEEARKITSGERFDVKRDADYLAALLEEFSSTTNYWAVKKEER
jgi:hypothetical protein